MTSKDIKNPGEIIRTKYKILDQFDGETWVKTNKFEKYLLDKYNISLKEYYNLVMYGTKDSPKCKCGNELPFRGLGRLYPKVCSNSCPCKRDFTIISKDSSKFIKSKINIELEGVKYTIYNPGEITRTSRVTVLDQLSGRIVRGANRFLKPYLLDNYSLTLDEYYNLIIYLDKDKIHKCSYCEKELKIKSIVLGYGEYCNESCSAKGVYINKEYKGLGNGVLSTLKASKNSFITKHKGMKGYLYIASIDNFSKVKIGVTTSLKRRSSFDYNIYGEYNSIKPILYDDVSVISELEYKIKVKFINSSVIGTESYDWNLLHDIIKYIKEII